MHVCIGKLIKLYSGYCMQYMGKGKVEMALIDVKVISIQYYLFA